MRQAVVQLGHLPVNDCWRDIVFHRQSQKKTLKDSKVSVHKPIIRSVKTSKQKNMMFAMYPYHISDTLFQVKSPNLIKITNNCPSLPRLACRVGILLSCTGRHSCQWQQHRKKHLRNIWTTCEVKMQCLEGPMIFVAHAFVHVILKASCQDNNTMSSHA